MGGRPIDAGCACGRTAAIRQIFGIVGGPRPGASDVGIFR